MRKLSTAIDRFCSRHPRFGIPNLMLFIVIGNVIVYLFSSMDRSGYFTYYLLFSPTAILHGQIWRLITFIFVPSSGNIFLLFISLYFYYFIGSTLERQWGSAKFTLYYLSGILFNIIYGMIAGLISGSSVILLDASYINLSMFFVFATYYPDNRVLLFFVIPIKIKWLAYADAALFALGVVSSLVEGSVVVALLPIVAVLNYFIFCYDMIAYHLSGFRKRNYRPRNDNVINMKKAARRAKAETEGKPYTRKCAVCGRTDTDHPELEFRYCSKCAGYHCFCEDHINNHIHFTE